MIRNLFIILLAISSICSAVPSFRATKATERIYVTLLEPTYAVDVSGDIMVFQINTENGFKTSVRRRGPDGMYNEFLQLDEKETPLTNGEWIAVLDRTSDVNWNIYKLDGDTILGNKISIPSNAFSTAAFFPGNVLVGESHEFAITLDLFIYTDSWTYNSSVDILDHYVMSAEFIMSQDGKFVLTSNDTFVDIWKFEPNIPTFERVESIAYDPDYSDIGIYNGVDTVITTDYYTVHSGVAGAFKVYSKINGTWNNTQTATAYELGLIPHANLGVTGAFIDENLFVLTAYSENTSGVQVSSPSGRCVAMSRGSDGLWTQILYIEVDSNDVVSFGMNVVVNDRHELLIPGFNFNSSMTTGYIYSSCVTSPINVTCHNVQADCDNLDVTALYTVNNSPACGDVNATVVSSMTLGNNTMVELKFTKPGRTASCSSTVTCTATPVSAPGVALPATAPIAVPYARRTSSAVTIELTNALLFTVGLLAL